MKKVYVVGPATYYASWIENIELVQNQEDANIIMFTGGCDINPKLYKCKQHLTTYFNEERDKYEIEHFLNARTDQLCIGTCRGAQLFTALLGGKLVQDVSGHEGSSHGLKLVSNKFGNILPEYCFTTSIHHQMMYPFELNKDYYDILYTSKVRMSQYYRGDGIDPNVIIEKGEPEVILYHFPDKPVCLGIQGHPEMCEKDSAFTIALNSLINEII